MKSFGRTRRQVLGQHFLTSKPTIEKILKVVREQIEKKSIQSILEIGPGEMALTRGLLTTGLPLYILERDQQLEAGLKEGLKESNSHLFFGDAASDDLLNFYDTIQEHPVLLASNLPYSASSQILAKLCELLWRSKNKTPTLKALVVMVQKEMALRMCATEKDDARGAFSVLIESYFHSKILFHVRPGAFSPPPKIDSTVLLLEPKLDSPVLQLKNPKDFEIFCKKLFSQRRKMIRKILPKETHARFQALNLTGTERPETLSLDILLQLFV